MKYNPCIEGLELVPYNKIIVVIVITININLNMLTTKTIVLV